MPKFPSSKHRYVSQERHLASWEETDAAGNTIRVCRWVYTKHSSCRHSTTIDPGETTSCTFCHQEVTRCVGECCERIVSKWFALKNWKHGCCPNCEDDYC